MAAVRTLVVHPATTAMTRAKINCAARARPRSTLTTNPANTDDPNSGTGRANVSETVNANSTTSTSAHSPDAQRAPCTARAASPRHRAGRQPADFVAVTGQQERPGE